MKIKDDLHQLIDSTNNEKLLETYYHLMQQLSSNSNGVLWNVLNVNQQEELLLSYKESLEQENLLNHEDVKASARR